MPEEEVVSREDLAVKLYQDKHPLSAIVRYFEKRGDVDMTRMKIKGILKRRGIFTPKFKRRLAAIPAEAVKKATPVAIKSSDLSAIRVEKFVRVHLPDGQVNEYAVTD